MNLDESSTNSPAFAPHCEDEIDHEKKAWNVLVLNFTLICCILLAYFIRINKIYSKCFIIFLNFLKVIYFIYFSRITGERCFIAYWGISRRCRATFRKGLFSIPIST